MTRTITPTYVLLNQITLAANANNITFSNIPQNYGDLVIVYTGQTLDSGNFDVVIRLNGDTSNHSFVAMGAETSSYSYTATTPNTINPGTGNRTSGIYQIMDYSATDKHKVTLIRIDAAARTVGAGAQRWASTSAVTSVYVGIGAGNYIAGSTFFLYGVHA